MMVADTEVRHAARDRRVLPRADQYRLLCRRRSRSVGLRGHRQRARLRPGRGADRDGACRPDGRAYPRAGADGSTGSSRRTSMPTTCRRRPTCATRWAGGSGSARGSPRSSTPSPGSTTPSGASRGTGRSSTTCSRTARRSRSAGSRRSISPRRGTRRPADPTGSATTSSWATRCSCPTTAPRAATFPAATRARCTARSGASSPTSRRPCSGSATTTARRAARALPGGRRSVRSGRRTRR